MNFNFYVRILGFCIEFINNSEEGELTEELERFESARELTRGILSVTGLHRMTMVLGEGWQIFTAIKQYGTSSMALSACAVPVESCLPAHDQRNLHEVGHAFSVNPSYASMVEEETHNCLSLLNDLIDTARQSDRTDPELEQWFADLRLAISAVQFGLAHRGP